MQYVAHFCLVTAMFVTSPNWNTLVASLLIFLQIAIGTKTGEILIYNLASSALIETVKAHTASVWSLHIRPDEQALVSGSADKDVKFWEFEWKDAKEDAVCIYFSLCIFV